MMFDQAWMADLLALQKKAADLAKEPNAAAQVQDLVMDVLRQWGIHRFPWQENPQPATTVNWNLDITETKHQVIVETNIPGIEAAEDILIKLQGDLLCLSGRSRMQQDPLDNGDGAFCRQVRLPDKVTPLGAEASYQGDRLKIILPKISAATETVIPVNFLQPQ